MKITLFETYGKVTPKTEESQLSFIEEDGIEEKVINLYPENTYQTMEGFGGALTDAAGYIFSKLDEEQKEEVLSTYFTEEQMNYQMVRIPIDSCDFSRYMFEADSDPEDVEFTKFSLKDVEETIIPLLDAIEKKAEKKIPIFFSPWSPPSFMKTNHERKHGGHLKKEYYGRWADYICRYLKEFKDRGYVINRLSIQNEPKAVQTWDSCIYTPEEEKIFLRDFLYPALVKNQMEDIDLYIWDHNKERVYERATDLIDETTKDMIKGVAFHWYSGDHFEALSLVREKFPDQKLTMSESCLEFSKYEKKDEYVNAGRLAHDMIGNLNHGMNSFFDWNILLDHKGGPNHVGNFCDAPFLYNTETKELERRHSLHYYWHFTHFIKPSAVRIAHTCYTSELEVTAWKNPDSQITFFILNRTTKEHPFVLRIGGRMVKGTVKPCSLSTGIIEGE